MANYAYEISGTAANGQTWHLKENVTLNGSLSESVEPILYQAFRKITGGRAVYGHPGVGCNGPYHITKLVIEVTKITSEEVHHNKPATE